MIYQLYQAQADFLLPFREAARFGAGMAQLLETGCGARSNALRNLRAAWRLFAETGLTHRRPCFGIRSVDLGNQFAGVTEEVAADTPFGTLLHFRKETPIGQPRVLLVAPMSGHFATLLRHTVEVMLPEHDLYITDWKNARDTPLSAGAFGLDEFVDHLIRFLEVIGPGAHIVAVCQPAVPALAAVALMAEAGNPAQPHSMTLMAGPIDTRVNPTRVNELAMSRPIAWFEQNLIGVVPWGFPGAGRRVYPGFLQLAAFIGMNLDRHVTAHWAQFRNLVGGDQSNAEAHRKFYGEYGAVMDLPAEFYLETVQRVFQEHHLPERRLTWRGEIVRPEAIRRTGLLTVEGERDDICAIGQTMAALDLCSGIRVNLKQNHLQTGVGHYGVFAGKRWAREVYPRVREMIQVMN
ncbi:MAG TPA: polyhydroxyalkanoate depolymerase [Acetobacteraceae bacterium]|nr:polyhydroxyalkanoate depolymerase [Acetobacteraceae bacterium]